MLVYFVFCLYFISNFVSCGKLLFMKSVNCYKFTFCLFILAQYDKTPDGYLIGALSNPKPKAKIQGNIYFVDATNIFIKNLQYTYEAPGTIKDFASFVHLLDWCIFQTCISGWIRLICRMMV